MSNDKKDINKEKEMEAVYEKLNKMHKQLQRLNDAMDEGFSKTNSKLDSIEKKIPEKKHH